VTRTRNGSLCHRIALPLYDTSGDQHDRTGWEREQTASCYELTDTPNEFYFDPIMFDSLSIFDSHNSLSNAMSKAVELENQFLPP